MLSAVSIVINSPMSILCLYTCIYYNGFNSWYTCHTLHDLLPLQKTSVDYCFLRVATQQKLLI